MYKIKIFYKLKDTVIFVLLALFILTTIIILNISINNTIEKKLFNSLNLYSEQCRTEFSKTIDEHLLKNTIIAKNFSNFETLSVQAVRMLIHETIELNNNDNIKSVFVVSKNSRIINKNGLFTPTQKQRAFFTRSMNSSSFTSQSILHDFNANGIVMISTPISNSNDEVAGVFCMTFDSNKLSEMFIPTFTTTNEHYYICDNNGVIISHSNFPETSLEINNIFDFYDNKSNTIRNVRVNLRDGISGFYKYNENNTTQLVNYKPLSINNWYIFAIAPDELITSETIEINTAVMMLNMCIVFICAMTGLMLISKISHANIVMSGLQESYTTVLEKTNDIFFESNVNTDSFINRMGNWETLFGTPTPERYSIAMHEIMSICTPEYSDIFFETFNSNSVKIATHQGKTLFQLEYNITLKGNKNCWITTTLVPILNVDHELQRVICTIQDVTEEKLSRIKMMNEAQRDGLSGLYNKLTTQRLVQNFLESDEGAGGNHAMLIIDIDHFKEINDNLGHIFGDDVISSISTKLKSLFRASDIVGRIGGDEFMVFIKNFSNMELIMSKIQEIQRAFKNSYKGESNVYHISASIGVSFYEKNNLTFIDLYKNADSALYCSKDNGRDKCTFFTPIMNQSYITNEKSDINSTNVYRTPHETSENGDITKYILGMLYGARESTAAVNYVLKTIGEHFGVSRVFIIENTEDAKRFSMTYEWCNKNIIPQKNRLQNYEYPNYDAFYQIFNNEGVFFCDDFSTHDLATQAVYRARSVKSLLNFAIISTGKFYGYIGINECVSSLKWSAEMVSELIILTKTLSMFLIKKNSEEKATALGNVNAYTYIIDKNTLELLYVNTKIQSLNKSIEVGKVCYKVLMKRETPCEVCPIRSYMQELKSVAIETYNPILNQWMSVNASPTNWSGIESAMIVTAHDITKYKENL